MSDADPIAPEPRFSIRLPRPLWIGLAAVVLVVVAVGLRTGVPIYRQQVALREIERLGGRAYTEKGGPDWLRRLIGDERMAPFDEVYRVNLEGTEFGDGDVSKLVCLSRLRDLLVRRTQITDDGLASISRLSQLWRLDLTATRVTDVGLCRLRRLARLKRIGLAYTRVSEAGVVELEALIPGLRVARGPAYDVWESFRNRQD